MRDTQHLSASHPVNFARVWLRIHDYFLQETSSQVAPGFRSVRLATSLPPDSRVCERVELTTPITRIVVIYL